ncbi:MAG: hypothetical protein KJ955_04135 [Nanoarchaeota archaeon]|nr:hypothetical protein [Nanoarchaeota archaeon]
METMEQQRQVAKKGLFEIVQEVAVELGEYHYAAKRVPGRWSTFDADISNRKYVFQRDGLKAVMDFEPHIEDDWKYSLPARVFVEMNGENVFHEVRDFPPYFGFGCHTLLASPEVMNYKPGDWETQLQGFYQQAMHMKAAREARKDSLRQRIRQAGDRRSASIF